MAADPSSRTDLYIIDVADPGGAPPVDAWALGRARLVAFKADRLLSAAKRELGAFDAATLSADLAPDLLEASEHVGQALAVLERLQAQLRDDAR